MAMNKLNGKSIEQLPYTNIRKVADLTYFDGPLLSLFRDTNDNNFIYYWYDSDEICNRWFVFRISEKQLKDYINQILTLRDMIVNPLNGHLYVVDIDGQGNFHNVLQIEPAYLPTAYLPQPGTYFDPSLSIFYEQEIYTESLATVLEENQKLRQNYPPDYQIRHRTIAEKVT